MSEEKHPHRAGRWDWIVFIITGPEENLRKFNAPVEYFDRRGQSIRCRAYPSFHDPGDRGMGNYELAVKAAKEADVTMQDLVTTRERENTQTIQLSNGAKATVSDCVEEYPVVHLGTHGMKWPPEKK